jgi:prophage regulatory protein
METVTINSVRFYKIHEVIGSPKLGIQGIIPMSRTAWYAGIKDGRYPAPIKLSERSSAWRSTDIDELVERLSSGNWQTVNQLVSR